jgi:hypothetical protein
MALNELSAFTQKVADAADQLIGNPAGNKAIFDAAVEELREYFNNAMRGLKSTASGDSGAKNLGATAINNVTGTDVQSILEDIASKTVQKLTPVWNTLPTFYSWSVDSGRGFAEYRKDALNEVKFRGSLHAGQLDSSAVPFNLPVGFRPAKVMDFGVKCIKADGSLSTTTIQINTVGDAHILNNYDAQIIVLDSIIFLAEQ